MKSFTLICILAIYAVVTVQGNGAMRWSKLVCDTTKIKKANDFIDDNMMNYICHVFDVNERPETLEDILIKMPKFLKNKPDIIERLNNAVCRLKQEYHTDGSPVKLSDLNNAVVFDQDNTITSGNDCITTELPVNEKIYKNYNNVYSFVDLTADTENVAQPQYLHDTMPVPEHQHYTKFSLQVLLVISIAIFIGISVISIGMIAYSIKNRNGYIDTSKANYEYIDPTLTKNKELALGCKRILEPTVALGCKRILEPTVPVEKGITTTKNDK
jgi:hypothetical protein